MNCKTVANGRNSLRAHFERMLADAKVMPRETFILELIHLANRLHDVDPSLTTERAATLAYTALSGPTAVATLSELPLAQLEFEHGDAVQQHRIACAALYKANQDAKLAMQRLHDTTQELLKRNHDAAVAEHKECS